MRREHILVVDDEEVMRDVLQTLLMQAGYDVTLAEDGAKALEAVRAQTFDAALVDVMLPEISGLDLLPELKKIDPDLVVVVITAYASVETAIESMRRGAFDYVTKPFKHEELLHLLHNGLNQRRLQDENRTLRSALRGVGAASVTTVEMAQGQKKSRILAWSFGEGLRAGDRASR